MRENEDKIQFITDDIANIPDLEKGEPFMVEGGNELYVGNGTENVKIAGGSDITVNAVPPDADGNIQINHTHVGALPVVNPVAQGALTHVFRGGATGNKADVVHFLYNISEENWAGWGIRDGDGMPWFRVGASNEVATEFWFPPGNNRHYNFWIGGVPLSHVFLPLTGGTITGSLGVNERLTALEMHCRTWMQIDHGLVVLLDTNVGRNLHVTGAIATNSSVSADGWIVSHTEVRANGRMLAGGGIMPSDASLLGPDAWTIHPWVDGIHPNLHYRHPHWEAGHFHTFPLAIRARPGVSDIGHAHVSINQFQEVIFSIYLNAYVHNGQHITTVPAGFRPVLHQALATGHAFGIGQAATFRINQSGVVQYVGTNYGGEVWAQCAYVGGV